METTTFQKDSQNPYRSGVLIGNHTEDRYGSDLTYKPDPKWGPSAVTEQQSQYNMGNTMSGFGRENFASKPTTEDEIVEEQISHMRRAPDNGKVKRDYGTMNEMFFDKKMATEKMINPHFNHAERKKLHKESTNVRVEDLPILGKTGVELNPKSYSDATKLFDESWRKTGFRE